jgi:hypothetical protein
MSLSTSKSDIYNQIKLYTSIANSNLDNQNLDNILSNSDNPLDFILDLTKITVGQNGIEMLTQVALTKVISQKYLNTLSDKIYDFIGNNISNELIISATTIDIPIKSIDPTNQFAKPQTTQTSATQTNQFFRKIKEEILRTPSATFPFSIVNTNKEIKLSYDETQDLIKTEIPKLSALELFTGLRVIIGPMFSANVVINEILNILFHTNFEKEDAQVLTIVRSYTNYETKDVFKLDLKKLLDLELETSTKGYNVDISCFRENVTITDQQIDSVISNPTVEKFKTLIPQFNTETTNGSANNANEDYFRKIIESIGDAILSIIVKQPVIMFFISIYHKIENAVFNLKTLNIGELFDKFKAFFEKLFDDIYEEIICVLFNWIKKYLIKLVVGVTIILLKEQLEKRKSILSSLSSTKFREKAKQFNI